MMRLSIPALFFLTVAGASPAFGAETWVLIADGGVKEAAVTARLEKHQSHPELVFENGFPKVMKSDAVVGLKPGFHVVVLGFCPGPERLMLRRDTESEVRTNYDTRTHELVLQAAKVKFPGTYARKVTAPPSCPRWLPSRPADDAAARLWEKARDEPENATALAAYGAWATRQPDTWDAAEYYLARAVQLSPTLTQAQVDLYRVLFLQDR